LADPFDAIRKLLPPEYVLGAPLAKGGQGAVFRGTYKGEDAAIKLFGPTSLERLKREVAMLQAINCPSLIQLLAAQMLTTPNGTLPILAYKFADGVDLRKKTAQGWSPTEAELIELGCSAGHAIEALWAQRIVHRDIKPENIIACTSGGFVVVDVGLAQHLNLKTITAGGQPGTRGYRSPEQIKGRKKLTVHTDVFALGVTMYELATGKHPWGRDEDEMVKSAAPAISSEKPGLDVRLAGLIDAMLTSKPGMRPAQIGQRFEALRAEGA